MSPLVADGLLERCPYRTNPVRHAYVLTERGRSLRPVIVALVDFTTGAKAVPEKAQVRGAVLARAEEDGHRVVLHALTLEEAPAVEVFEHALDTLHRPGVPRLESTAGGGTARGGRRPPPPRTAPLVSPARGKLRAARGMARAVRRTGPSAGP